MSELEGQIGDLVIRVTQEGFDWRWTVVDRDGGIRATARDPDQHFAWCEAMSTALKASRAQGAQI
ncbi:MAG: hypothetical protein J0I28_02940 [Caulobacterales bacterium]|nr:hypothetical protein [Caulobacterales bacterium]